MNGAVFVTGGSGLVGKAIVQRLVRDDRTVKALARSEEATRVLDDLGVIVARGDITDTGALQAAMQGCDVAYHVAGLNALCLNDPAPLFEVNVDGSRNVIEAAAKAGVARVVYTSSAATLGERRGTVGREDSSHRGWFLSAYERSKFEAEKVVLQSARDMGVEVVSVNPSSVQGPGRAGGTGKVLMYYVNGKLKLFVDTRISIVDIADCAEGHILAEAKGRPGERYLLNGHSLTSKDLLDELERVTTITRRPRLLPPFLALTAGAAVGGVARLARRHPPVCREMVRTMLHGHTYDGSKARDELGLSYTPLEHTLVRTIAWLADEGLAPRSVLR